MPTYQTRHLEALREFNHGGRALATGDTFAAADVDAEYYLKHRMAREAADQQAAPAVGTESAPKRAAVNEPAPAAKTTGRRGSRTAPDAMTTLADISPAAAEAAAPTTETAKHDARAQEAGDAA